MFYLYALPIAFVYYTTEFLHPQFLPRCSHVCTLQQGEEFSRNLHITYFSVWIIRAIKEQEEARVMTSSFSDKKRVVLDRLAEILRSKIR